jgi:hypothetical protein
MIFLLPDLFWKWFWKERSIFSHCVRMTLHTCPKLSPASSDDLTTLLDVETTTFFTKHFLFDKMSLRARGYMPPSSRKHDGDHGALPPCPQSCQNMTRTVETSDSSCQVSSISWFVVDIRGLIANGIACPWLKVIWVVPYHSWLHLLLHCQFVVACGVGGCLCPNSSSMILIYTASRTIM